MARLEDVIQRMDQRLEAETTASQAARLWTSAYILMGLRFPPEVSEALLQGVVRMRESSTYQVILEEGRQEGERLGSVAEARRLLLLLGETRLGPAGPAVRKRVEGESGIERIEELVCRVLTAASWEELLD